jgi:hypothetical protein
MDPETLGGTAGESQVLLLPGRSNDSRHRSHEPRRRAFAKHFLTQASRSGDLPRTVVGMSSGLRLVTNQLSVDVFVHPGSSGVANVSLE